MFSPLPEQRKSLIALLIAACATAAVVTPALAGDSDPPANNPNFGFLFPTRHPLNAQTPQQLADLAQTMQDPGADINNNCPDGATVVTDCVGAGFTYTGQFIDHDLTLDTLPQPHETVDPTTLVNNRTFRFDLDSVYGDGPDKSPQLYQADGTHLRVQDPNPNGVRDLPRNPDGSAILIEPRNDENEIIAQLHVGFLKLHNMFVDEGNSFRAARKLTILYYQRAVVDDFLPHILGEPSVGPEADRLADGMTPVEFSVAAYRFGHSLVRASYHVNDTTGALNVFDGTPNDLAGGRQLPAGRQIEWGNFFPELEETQAAVVNGTPDPNSGFNIGRKMDTLISAPLFKLPIPGAEATGSNILAFRNMLRAKFYDMPSGQNVARRMGLTPLTDEQLALPDSVAGAFAGGVPLWYYVLREASVMENGEKLGPVGSQIVGETFLSTLKRDPMSILRGNRDFQPDPAIAPDGKVHFSDLLVAAGVAERPDVADVAAAPAVDQAPAPDPVVVHQDYRHHDGGWYQRDRDRGDW